MAIFWLLKCTIFRFWRSNKNKPGTAQDGAISKARKYPSNCQSILFYGTRKTYKLDRIEIEKLLRFFICRKSSEKLRGLWGIFSKKVSQCRKSCCFRSRYSIHRHSWRSYNDGCIRHVQSTQAWHNVFVRCGPLCFHLL